MTFGPNLRYYLAAMGRNALEAWGYTFLSLGVLFMFLTESEFIQNDDKVLPVLVTMGGLVMGLCGSWIAKTDHKPAIPADQQHDPMRNADGTYQF